MTPSNYYLWRTVKDKCYAEKPETTDALKDNIRVGYCMKPRHCLLLTGGIVLPNIKRNLRKYLVIFVKAFSKKKEVFGGPCI